MFSDSRTEKELVEKWFLEVVESKLNKDENQIKKFQEILQKYTELQDIISILGMEELSDEDKLVVY